MTSLVLSKADHIKIRSSWADAMALNHYNDENFVKRLFKNLIASDANVKAVFKDPVTLEKQEVLFMEMLRFVMMYLDKAAVLDECMNAFIQENPSVIKYGVSYLEPLGSVLINTLRQILGSEKFHAGLETLWIKVYIYVANSILQNDASDVESVISNTAQSSSSLEEEVQPLNCKSFSSPAPKFTSSPPPASASEKISIDLRGNEKYRGFRRSVNEATGSKVSVKVPASLSASPSVSSFASTLQTDDVEPVLTPRSHRRNSVKQLEGLGLNLSIPEVATDSSSLGKGYAFDPRRRSHARTGSELSLGEMTERKVSSSSCESPISDVDDQLHLEQDDMNFNTLVETRAPVFDHNSFGIAGLAPIAESEDDDEKSTHSSTNRRSSEYESSSRTSSLSLHNSDYKSSISSGSGNSALMDKPFKTNVHENVVSRSPEFSSPYAHVRRSSSVPSLISRTSGQRASMGFMRSSFILKKEMNDLGYNHPENVVSSAIQHRVPSSSSSVYLPSSRSVCSLPTQYKREHVPSNESTISRKNVGADVASTTVSEAPTKSSVKSDKSSFRKMMRNIFGSSSSSSAPVSSKKISHPIAVSEPPKRSTHSSRGQYVTQTASSITPSMHSSKRVSSMDIRGKPAPVGYASSVYSKPSQPFNDNASMISTNSGKSSFTLFRSRKKEPKGSNKYLVKKVPYQTVYLKDIVS